MILIDAFLVKNLPSKTKTTVVLEGIKPRRVFPLPGHSGPVELPVCRDCDFLSAELLYRSGALIDGQEAAWNHRLRVFYVFTGA